MQENSNSQIIFKFLNFKIFIIFYKQINVYLTLLKIVISIVIKLLFSIDLY